MATVRSFQALLIAYDTVPCHNPQTTFSIIMRQSRWKKEKQVSLLKPWMSGSVHCTGLELRDFRLPSRCKWNFRYSVLLCSDNW